MEKTENKKPYLGVDAIILNENKEILLIKRTGKNFNGYWGLVSGMVEWNETIEDTIKREVKEEIGVDVELVNYTGKYYDKIGRHPTKTVICLPHFCKIINGTPSAVSECSEVKWFTAEEIREIELAYDQKQMLIDQNLI